MAKRYDLITELYRDTQKNVTDPAKWKEFLSSACRNYRLSFDDQLLVYAQRPDATAVLEIERWNKRFGRWVNRGATGIAVFDKQHTGRSRLKYYFDISDTHGSRRSRPVPIWEMRPEFENEVIDSLENCFGDLENRDSLADALLSVTKNAVEDHIPDYLAQLCYYKEGSFLEVLDEESIDALFRPLVQSSVGYMLFVRCGIDPANYFADEDFSYIGGFNTPETLNALGVATGDISQICLEEISRTVLSLQRQAVQQNRTFAEPPESEYPNIRNNTTTERSEHNDRDHLHDAGRLPSAQPAASPGAGNSPWEVRIDAPELPAEAPQGDVHESADQRQAEHAPDGDPADRHDPDGADREATGAGAGSDGGAESPRPDEVGGSDEQHPALGGGDHSEGTDPQLTDENAGGDELPAFSDDHLIMGIIANKDDDLKYKKKQIELYFAANPDPEKRTEYIMAAYPDRFTEVIIDGVRVGYHAQDDGLLMWEGSYLSRTKESIFSWELVAELTGNLIEHQTFYLNTAVKATRALDDQMSFMDLTLSEPDDESQLTLFSHPQLSQQIIDEALCVGSNNENSRLIICAHFMKDKPMEENAAFLQKHYGTNGAGFYFDGQKVSIWYAPEGMRISYGESALKRHATVLTWEQAAKRIRELLDMGRYMPQNELDRVVEYERHSLADRLVNLRREFSDEAIEAGYLPLVSLAYSSHSGFPEIDRQVETMLADPEMLNQLVDELELFVNVYQYNRDLLRFHYPRPAELLGRLHDLQREPVVFRAADGYDPQRQFFISQDEIDDLLRSGSVEYRLAVYAYYRTHPDKKGREKFMSHYHGEYSGYNSGNDNVTFTYKSLSFSHGSCVSPYAKVELKWNKAAARVAELIASNQFLSEADRTAMPDYEIKQLATKIRSFFYNAPDVFQRPYEDMGFGEYWKEVEATGKQLGDRARVEQIYQDMMLPLWNATAQDDRNYNERKAGIEAMQAFLDGTFSVFGTGKTLRPPTDKETAVPPDESPVQPKKETELEPVRGNTTWQEYQQIQAEHPDAVVLYQAGDFFEVFGDKAEPVAQTLELTLADRHMGLEKRVPMCGVPYSRLESYMNMLLHRGFDVVLSSLEDNQRVNAYLPSSHKDAPEATFPVGRIDYLGSNGKVKESIEYTTADGFVRDILEENHNGVPMTIVLYRDRDSNTIPQDFLQQLDPPPQGLEIVNSPYLEEVPEPEVPQGESLAAPTPRRERVVFSTAHPEIPREQRQNFQITDPELGYGSKGEKYAANVAAIRLLKRIEAEDRLATPKEQEVLSRYVGWGGLADCFDDRHHKYRELKSLLTEEEYAAARESSLTAFYTSPVIIGAMYQALEQMGFQSGNILEPSCGVGNFIGMLPASMAGSRFYGVELDSISGRIAQQLYQNSSIAVTGFEKVDIPDSFFDVAIGNVPFGDFKLLDKRYDKNHWLIHDYFFGKALDKVRPGGVVAFITSKGTLDKENGAVRKYLAQRADLIGAIRLPNIAFKQNAGTEVTSDIIFLQKRDRMTDIEPDWVHLDTDANGIRMNSYFVQHPEMVLGDMVMESGRFGMESTCKAREGEDLSEQLRDAITNLHAQITSYEMDELDEEEDLSIPADPAVRNFSYTIVDGKLYFRENSRMFPVETSATGENRIRGMIALRDCVRRLIELQTENYPDEDIQKEQALLNTLYDSYTAKYGRLYTRGNSLAFGDDSSYCLLCSLEVLDNENNFERKADMFTKRTIRSHEPVTSVDTASEALAVSIAEKARVDMEFMSQLSGKTEEELEAELSGVIYRDIQCAESASDIPESHADLTRYPFVTADEYLSGNVRRKLRMVKAMLDSAPPEKKGLIQGNVNALEAVQPVDLTAGEIGVRIGANWVPIEIYQQFMYELFGTSVYAKSKIHLLHFEGSGEWNITNKSADSSNIRITTTYGTKRINAYHILEQTLNQKDVRIFDTKIDANGNEYRVLNKKETAIAQDRQELIKAKFTEWLWKDIDRREMLCGIYNETFNAIRPREYDGSHINFVGMNPEFTLRKHQINAIAHIMYGGNTLLAHEVGAGKTFEMVAAAMESKRLGLCSKSLIVVPNHITEQWAAEWLQLYPSANILVATRKDFETQNRKKFCGRIATGDYDAIIIGHSQFEKIPMSKERQEVILRRQISQIMDSIMDAKSAKAERYTIKQLEKNRKSLETRLTKLNDQSRKDDVVTFEELGVDRIFIDESHYFKNLFLATKMRNVGGIAQTEAQKSSDLFMKCQYLDEITGSRGVIFATGTPISNSMVELYTIQRYLQYSTLAEMNMLNFDDWAANFGETITAIELSPEGSGYRAKTRFAKFYNLPELMATFKQVADIQTADMLKLPVPKANFHTEVIKPSPLQQEMVKSLADRAEVIRAGGVDPSVDNMLRITNDGRKLALDMRLINPLAPDDENGKVAVCARNVFGIWNRTREQRCTQMVFCDLSTPKGDGSFNVYDDLKSKLMAMGIPAEEIAFIHNANTEARKKELFGKVRAGQVRVLIGSTQKMGAGTNCQDRLIALHDLDCPWRPSDLAQRLGRIVRQGNQNPEVEIFRYVTENTFDAYLYQLVENKQRFVAQVMTSKTPVRAADDVDETALSYSEIKALATGNPLIIEKCNLDMEVSKLNVLKASHMSQKYALEDLVHRRYPAAIAEMTEKASGYEQDAAIVASNPKPQEGFVGMEVNGTILTDKEAAGKAIINTCTSMTGTDAVFLGQYRGFAVTVFYDAAHNQYRLTMKGTLSHSITLGGDVLGNITRMDNALGNIAGELEATRLAIADTQEQLVRARTEMETPFAKEAELAEKTARLKKLNILLNMDQKEHTLVDDAPDEETPEKTKSRGQER